MSIKKAAAFCLVSCLLSVLTTNVSTADFKKTKIAVLDFVLKGESFKTKDMGAIVAEWFTTAMVQDGRFEVVERALMQKIVEEQKLGMTGLIDESSSAQIGKILGVKTIISGSVLQLENSIEVNARIINVNTGSIVAAENIRSTTGANLQSLIEELTHRIVKNFPLTGYIVKKREDSVVIDLGLASGLQEGMKFIVFKEGEVIKHPKTGEVLEVEQIRTGLISITQISANIATAKILQEEAGQQIQYGQMVQSVAIPTAGSDNTPPPAVASSSAQETTQTTQTAVPPTTAGEGEYVRQETAAGERDNLISGGQGPAVLTLPTGSFMMGTNSFPEKPPHYVNVSKAVLLMTNEVTFADFEKFCRDTNRPLPDDAGWGRDDRPVINVSWQDAQDYAAWLTKQTGATYRLPFETEWEWAATAGGRGTTYPWGNNFQEEMANCRDCGSYGKQRQTALVRSFPANPIGLHDMAGNVWEWVLDCWVENYGNAPDDQSAREVSGRCGNYTIRGGGWNSPARQITTTYRMGIWAETRSNYIGFRLVKDPFDLLQAASEPANATLPVVTAAIASSANSSNTPVVAEKKKVAWQPVGEK